jgi:hypothetical protein
MRATYRVAVLVCAAALAGGAVPAADAMIHTSASAPAAPSSATHQRVARIALDRLLAGRPVAGERVDVAHLVRATVCFDGACVHRRLRPNPACDPSAGACIGTAERAWRRNHFTVVVELL